MPEYTQEEAYQIALKRIRNEEVTQTGWLFLANYL